MYVFNRITVNPQLPKRIEKLAEIANNLWWSWNTEFLRLFQKIDRDLWEESSKNPVKFLKNVSQERLEKASKDILFLKVAKACVLYNIPVSILTKPSSSATSFVSVPLPTPAGPSIATIYDILSPFLSLFFLYLYVFLLQLFLSFALSLQFVYPILLRFFS